MVKPDSSSLSLALTISISERRGRPERPIKSGVHFFSWYGIFRQAPSPGSNNFMSVVITAPRRRYFTDVGWTSPLPQLAICITRWFYHHLCWLMKRSGPPAACSGAPITTCGGRLPRRAGRRPRSCRHQRANVPTAFNRVACWRASSVSAQCAQCC